MQGAGGVPVKKSIAAPAQAEFLEQAAGGGIEGGIELGRELRMLARLVLEFRQAESDARLDLVGEVQVVARDVGKQRIDEMQPPQLVGAGHPLGVFLDRALISSTNSVTSRNSL